MNKAVVYYYNGKRAVYIGDRLLVEYKVKDGVPELLKALGYEIEKRDVHFDQPETVPASLNDMEATCITRWRQRRKEIIACYEAQLARLKAEEAADMDKGEKV